MEAFTALIEPRDEVPRSTEHTLRKPTIEEGRTPFSYLVHHTSLDGRLVVVAEMHWSDLSVVATGFLAPLRNFFRLMVAAPDIVYAALGPTALPYKKKDYFLLRIIRSLLGFAFWMIFLPCIAYNLVFGVMFLTYVVVRLHNLPVDLSPDGANLVGSLLFSSCALLAALNLSNAYLKALLYWTSLMLLVLALVAASGLLGFSPPRTTSDYKNILDVGLLTVWTIPLSITYAFTAIVPILIIFFRNRWRGLLLANAAVYLIVRFWIVLITAVWLFILSNSLGEQQFRRILDLSTESLWFMGYMWLVVAAVIVLVLISYFSYEIKSARTADNGAPYPRLIIPTSLLALTLIVPAVWEVVLLYWAFTQFGCIGCTDWSVNWWMPLTRQILENAWWLVAAGGVCIQLLGGGFKIATDIVSYFRTNALQRAVNPLAAVSSTFGSSAMEFGDFREELRARMAALCSDLNKTFGPFQEMDIVAHSLGTMVAVDAIRSQASNVRGPNTVIRLITMGSPYRNVFQYYFPDLFPDITPGTLPGIAECLNIYRANDYVGTTIAPASYFVRDRCQSPKGHHGYFGDPKVVSEIVGWPHQ